MYSQEKKISIVFTNKAICRDCYRCVRACPVDAISVIDGQAQVISERCIACGTCVNECPQKAKTYRNDLEKINEFIDSKEKLAFSIAPSFAALFNNWEQKNLASAIRSLGAVYVGETAVGAYDSASSINKYINDNKESQHICSSCPAVVNLIEKYYSKLVPSITPVVSPMIAHARIIREKFKENVKIVFVGPCITKKDESVRPEYKGLVDIVLTFDEFHQLLKMRNIDLRNCEESSFDEKPKGKSRFFPIEGGLLKTAGIESLDNNSVVAVSGESELVDVLRFLKDCNNPMIVEPMFCRGGCVNGPCGMDNNGFLNRNKLVEFAINNSNGENAEEESNISFFQRYNKRAGIVKNVYSEEEIQRIMEETGKGNVENQLNCSACGYDSCREKAIAVLDGIAELEMCIPYMRRLAEQKNDLILETVPSGIVILDEKLQIVAMNPAFRKMFLCGDAVLGKKISYLVDPDPFEKLLIKRDQVIKTNNNYESYNLVCHQMHYCLKESRQYVGIFVDITESLMTREKLKEVKRDTILQATDLMEHQVKMAQDIAKYLGESSARSEMLMTKLIEAIGDK